jgi:hypothetical protein
MNKMKTTLKERASINPWASLRLFNAQCLARSMYLQKDYYALNNFKIDGIILLEYLVK